MNEISESSKKSKLVINLWLLIGIMWIAFNVGLFFFAQIRGATSDAGLIGFLTELKEENTTLLSTFILLEAFFLISWPTIFYLLIYRLDKKNIASIKQMFIAWIVLFSFISMISGMVMVSIYNKGQIGDLCRFLLALLCTPFTMEILLCTIGVLLVFSLNAIRLKLNGDEYVELVIKDTES